MKFSIGTPLQDLLEKGLVFEHAEEPLACGVVGRASLLRHRAGESGTIHSSDPALPTVMASPHQVYRVVGHGTDQLRTRIAALG